MSTSSSENTDLQPIWWKNFVAQITKPASNNGKCNTIFFSLFFFWHFWFIKKFSSQSKCICTNLSWQGKHRLKATQWVAVWSLLHSGWLFAIHWIVRVQGVSHRAMLWSISLNGKFWSSTKSQTQLFSLLADVLLGGRRWREKLEVSVLSVSPSTGLTASTNQGCASLPLTQDK